MTKSSLKNISISINFNDTTWSFTGDKGGQAKVDLRILDDVKTLPEAFHSFFKSFSLGNTDSIIANIIGKDSEDTKQFILARDAQKWMQNLISPNKGLSFEFINTKNNQINIKASNNVNTTLFLSDFLETALNYQNRVGLENSFGLNELVNNKIIESNLNPDQKKQQAGSFLKQFEGAMRYNPTTKAFVINNVPSEVVDNFISHIENIGFKKDQFTILNKGKQIAIGSSDNDNGIKFGELIKQLGLAPEGIRRG